jgi:hypothetical protein
MMTKKRIVGVVVGLVLVIVGVFFANKFNQKSFSQKENNNQLIKIINLDQMVRAPNQYQGFLGVEGIVIETIKSKGIFLLGCRDACVFMPVKYTGQMPKLYSNIIVYGKLDKREEDKYIFQGEKVEMK